MESGNPFILLWVIKNIEKDMIEEREEKKAMLEELKLFINPELYRRIELIKKSSEEYERRMEKGLMGPFTEEEKEEIEKLRERLYGDF